MNSFQKRTALRIALVSVVLAGLVSALAWAVARERAEDAIVSFAIEESDRLLRRFHAVTFNTPDAVANATAAAEMIAGGLFDIAEIYDSKGRKLAEAMTADGEAIEMSLPKHLSPGYVSASYQSMNLPGGRWVLRVFVPLRSAEHDRSGPVSGYFEGVRVVPPWQRDEIVAAAQLMALLAGLASLLCGIALYPVVVRLARENEQKTQEVLDAQGALIRGLQKSERDLEDKVVVRTQELEKAQARTRELLHNILPAEIADELSRTGRVEPARHESVSILFTDFCGFTQAVAAMPAARMVDELNEIFVAFDAIADACGVEKIKTIGDAYMAAAGLPKACPDHAQRCVRAGMQMIDYLAERNTRSAFKWALRVGVHSGPAVAGVVGKRKYAFDVWGDTVNIAARLESAGEPGRVNISAYTCDLIGSDFECSYRGKIDVKGKGALDMYFVTDVAQRQEESTP